MKVLLEAVRLFICAMHLSWYRCRNSIGVFKWQVSPQFPCSNPPAVVVPLPQTTGNFALFFKKWQLNIPGDSVRENHWYVGWKIGTPQLSKFFCKFTPSLCSKAGLRKIGEKVGKPCEVHKCIVSLWGNRTLPASQHHWTCEDNLSSTS